MASGTRSQKDKKPLDAIFFEKQDGRLCAQHCINNALQESVVDAVVLSEYAKKIDLEESRVAYEDNLGNGESHNYDDSGYFSVQVIQSALAPFSLDLININEVGSIAAAARNNPANAKVYIFHEKDHWYCARRFAERQWVLLNSLKEPVEITDKELTSMVATKVNGRQVFVVSGVLKNAEGDLVYANVLKDSGGVTRVFTDKGKSLGARSEDEQLQEALALSMGRTPQEILREKRAKFLENLEKKKAEPGAGGSGNP
jgi:ataxin-3